MASKTKKLKAAASSPTPVDKSLADSLAKLALQPNVHAALVIKEYGKPFGDLDLVALSDSLSSATNDVWGGDLKQCEAMLLGQAHALQAIFMSQARRANKSEHMDLFERHLRLALKAQSQCRTTLETLAAIKSPPVVFARQANIAHGHQQINNGMAPIGGAAIAHAENDEAVQNKLLEVQDGQRLDTGAAGAAGRADPAMATLDEIDRPPHQ